MPYLEMIKIKIIFIVTCLFLTFFVRGEILHFDQNLMAVNGITSDQLSNALNRYVLPDGHSNIEIYINGNYVTSGDIISFKGSLFFSEPVKLSLGIKKNGWLKKEKAIDGFRFALKRKITYEYDRFDNSIRIKVPAELLENPDGKKRLRGGVGAFVNYSTYAYHYTGGSGSFDNLSTDYETGINFNNTILRSHGDYSQFRSRNVSVSVNRVRDAYIERDFNRIRVRAGRTIINDGGFGTGYVDGAVISSAMGNASAFINFAYDAAEVLTVEIWQNNLLMWKQIIQKGHAELRNIPVAGFNGDVTVLVKRNGQIIDSRIIARGQITSFQDGTTGYYIFSGRTVNINRNIVSGAGFSRRLARNIAPTVAFASSGNYRGLTVRNSTINGNFRTISWVTGVKNEKGQHGLSLNLTTSYQNTSLSYNNNSRKFSYLGQALQSNYSTEQSSISLSQTQQFADGITGSISLTHYRFYDAPSNDAVSATLSLPIGKASLGMGLSYMSLESGRAFRDKVSTNLYLSVPLGFDNHSTYWRSQYYRYGDSARLSNSVSTQVTDTYTVTASHQRINGPSRTDSYMLDNSVLTPYTTADISLTQGRDASNTSQTTAAYLSGAVAISKKGIIFSPARIGDTWAVVDTGVHRYINVASLQNSVVTNHDGKAVISPVNEGRADFIRVNPEGLPSGMVIKNNVREFAAERGAVGFFNFNVKNNRSLLMRWKRKPIWVKQSDVFYSTEGKVIARFIDKDILLVSVTDIQQLETMGMSSPTKPNLQCKIIDFNSEKEESINNVEFKCNGT